MVPAVADHSFAPERVLEQTPCSHDASSDPLLNVTPDAEFTGDRQFLQFLQEHFELPSLPEPTDLLIEDLGFDSLRMLELVDAIEDLAAQRTARPPNPVEYPLLLTPGDAFQFFQAVLGEGVPQ
jgi:hypothetical protein